MAEKKLEIKRYNTFTVSDANVDEHGNLMVADSNGVEHKVGEKRKHLFELFQPNATVKVGYAEYMNKEYIATAEVLATVAHVTPEEHKAVVEAVKEVHKDTDSVRNRSMAISYAKDLVVVGKLEIGQIITAAEKFYLYMTSGKV